MGGRDKNFEVSMLSGWDIAKFDFSQSKGFISSPFRDLELKYQGEMRRCDHLNEELLNIQVPKVQMGWFRIKQIFIACQSVSKECYLQQNKNSCHSPTQLNLTQVGVTT